MTALRGAIALALAIGVTASLAGCIANPTSLPAHISSSPIPGATGTATPVPTGPLAIDPTGTAAQNQEFFRQFGIDHFGKHPNITGKAVIDDLVGAGFNKSAMEITPDKTSIGLKAWNIEFSIRMKGGCLIGQVGNVGFQETVQPILATGKCLIGKTRKIDW